MKSYSNVNFSQSVALKQMIYYIKDFNLEEGVQDCQYVELLKLGMCNGLSFLYSIYKLAGREDIFFESLSIISTRKRSDKLSISDKFVFESIIGQLILVQSRGEFLQPKKEDAGIQKFSHENYQTFLAYFGVPFEMNFYEELSGWRQKMTQEALARSIESEKRGDCAIRIQHGPKGVAFNLKTPGHVCILYKTKGKYILYEPNSPLGEQVFNSPHEVSESIWKFASNFEYQGERSFIKSTYRNLNKKNSGIPAETLYYQKVGRERKEDLEKKEALISIYTNIKLFIKNNYYDDINSKDELFKDFITFILAGYPGLENFISENQRGIQEQCSEDLWRIFIDVRATLPSRIMRPYVHKEISDLVDSSRRLINENILGYEPKNKIIDRGVDGIRIKLRRSF